MTELREAFRKTIARHNALTIHSEFAETARASYSENNAVGGGRGNAGQQTLIH